MTDRDANRAETIVSGILLLASGLILNYLFERHHIFKVWGNSQYPILTDLFYPALCVFLSLIGVVLIILAESNIHIRRAEYALAIAFPSTILYALVM